MFVCVRDINYINKKIGVHDAAFSLYKVLRIWGKVNIYCYLIIHI